MVLLNCFEECHALSELRPEVGLYKLWCTMSEIIIREVIVNESMGLSNVEQIHSFTMNYSSAAFAPSPVIPITTLAKSGDRKRGELRHGLLGLNLMDSCVGFSVFS